MLGHLFYYDFRETGRKLGMMYLVLAATCLLTNLFFSVFSSTNQVIESISVILMIVDFALAIALIVLTVVGCIERFYKNCYGPEGYLTFTLPVHPWQILLSKVLSSALLIVCTLAVLSGCVLLAIPFGLWGQVNMGGFFSEFGQMLQLVGYGNVAGVSLNILAAVALNLFVTILMIYLAISIGQLFSNHKVALSFIFFFVIESVIGILTGLVFTGTAYTVSETGMELSLDTMNGALYAVNGFIGGQSLWMLLLSAAMFFGTDYIMRKHLNLE